MKVMVLFTLVGLLVPTGTQVVEVFDTFEPVAIVQVQGAAGVLG